MTAERIDRAWDEVEAEVHDFKVHRAVIEQAKGVLMAMLSIDADRAFDLLVRYSQDHNIKLRDVADLLVSGVARTQTPTRHDARAVGDYLATVIEAATASR